MSLKALITGANGLIGANLIRELIRDDNEVIAFVRSTSDLTSLKNIQVKFAYGDVLDLDSLIVAAEGCDVIFHTAAVFTLQASETLENKRIAIEGTKNIIKAAHRCQIKRVILTASSVIFGSSMERSIRDETSKLSEIDEPSYVYTKKEQHNVAFSYAKKLSVELIAVCPTMVLGPHSLRLGPSNGIIVSYLNDKTRSTYPGGCNIVSVLDVAKGHILAAKRGQAYQNYILGGENLDWKTIHSKIAVLSGVSSPYWQCGYTQTYIAAGIHEALSLITKQPLLTSRSQAKMVGKYYWYSHQKIQKIGYSPIKTEITLAAAISWLAASIHISNSIRKDLNLSDQVYQAREKYRQYELSFQENQSERI